MNAFNHAWGLLKTSLGDQDFTTPFASDMGPSIEGEPRLRGPASLKVNNPKVPSNQREEEEGTYAGISPSEHPLYGQEGYDALEGDSGTVADPKLQTVSQDEFDEDRDSLDTSTPKDPFPRTNKSYAFDFAWSLLKADPDAQMRMRGTIPPSIMSMLARQGKTPEDAGLMSAGGPGDLTTEDVMPYGEEGPHGRWGADRTRFGDESELVPEVHHEDDGLGDRTGMGTEGRVTPAHYKGGEVPTSPEEGFLTPGQAFMSDRSLAANLRRNVGGQQQGGIMNITGSGNRGFKPTDLSASRGAPAQMGRGEGVANRMELRGRTSQFTDEPEPQKLTTLQAQQQRLQEMAETMGADFTPNIDMGPETSLEIPMELQNALRDNKDVGFNEVAEIMGVEPAAVRQSMRKLTGFRGGPSSATLARDQQAANLPEDMGFGDEQSEEAFNTIGRGAHTGDPKGFIQPTGGYAKFKQGQDEEAAMGIGEEGSTHSELMGMDGNMSPEAMQAALQRMGLDDKSIAEKDWNAQAAATANPDSDLRSMREGDVGSAAPVLGEEMGMVESANQQKPRTERFKGGQGNLYPSPDAHGKTRL